MMDEQNDRDPTSSTKPLEHLVELLARDQVIRIKLLLHSSDGIPSNYFYGVESVRIVHCEQ